MFYCKTCKVYEERIKYLEKLIDRLLVKQGSSPIVSRNLNKEMRNEEQDEAERIIENGGIVYGE